MIEYGRYKKAGGRQIFDRPPTFRWILYRVLLLFLYSISHITKKCAKLSTNTHNNTPYCVQPQVGRIALANIITVCSNNNRIHTYS